MAIVIPHNGHMSDLNFSSFRKSLVISVISISHLLLWTQLVETNFLFSGWFLTHFLAFSLACSLCVK